MSTWGGRATRVRSAALARILLDLETATGAVAAHTVEQAAEVGRRASGTEFEGMAWCVEAYALHARGDHDAALEEIVAAR